MRDRNGTREKCSRVDVGRGWAVCKSTVVNNSYPSVLLQMPFNCEKELLDGRKTCVTEKNNTL